VKGLHKFQNKTHSAAWDDSLQLDDKVVGIIGNGSSAVQILPAIFPRKSFGCVDMAKLDFYTGVKKVISFQRSSTWITAGFAQKFAGENGENFDCM
jgi:cation diffusion facilitator CzcD-associated flavoprotein CzcO